LARYDLFFLLRYVLSTREYFKPGEDGMLTYQPILDWCREIERDRNRILDVKARFHWKSNIKTYALPIQDILNDPNVTECIFSYNRPGAKKFLGQIQREIMTNKVLQKLSWHPLLDGQIFPDNYRDLPRNSLDEGIIVNRTTNPREPTLMATGLVDSLEVGPHYKKLNYDDVVTKDSVTTPEMIKKTTESWELSLMLSMPGSEFRYTGTFYAYDDTYSEMLKRGIRLRVNPCYELDHENSILADDDSGRYLKMAWHFDRPVLYEEEHLQQLWDDLVGTEGPKTANMQLLCDPSAGLRMGFDREDLRFYDQQPWEIRPGMNVYFLVDPANEKKKDSDYTAIWVLGAAEDGNIYVLDLVRDRLNLAERTDAIFRLHVKWKPVEVRYERYGLQADIQHIMYVQGLKNYRFHVREVAGNVRKDDRIERLIPFFKEHKVWLPRTLPYTNIEGVEIDLVKSFIEDEFSTWPNSYYKDMLDALSRLAEPNMPLSFPIGKEYYEEAWAEERRKNRYSMTKPVHRQTTWMSM
jgi:predicted phage terminase large subunit-like protein